MKLTGNIKVHCTIFSIDYRVHNTYHSFPGLHRQIRLQIRLLSITVANAFPAITEFLYLANCYCLVVHKLRKPYAGLKEIIHTH